MTNESGADDGNRGLVGNYKSLKRTVLIWCTAAISTFLVHNDSGNIGVAGFQISSENVGVLRLLLCAIAIYYFLEFLISFSFALRKYNSSKIDTSERENILSESTSLIEDLRRSLEGTNKELTRNIDTEVPTINWIGAPSDLAEILDNYLKGVRKTGLIMPVTYQPLQVSAIKQFDENQSMADKFLRHIHSIDSRVESINKSLIELKNTKSTLESIDNSLRTDLPNFIRKIRRLSGEVSWIERIQIYGFDLLTCAAVLAFSILLTAFPPLGETLVDHTRTFAERPFSAPPQKTTASTANPISAPPVR